MLRILTVLCLAAVFVACSEQPSTSPVTGDPGTGATVKTFDAFDVSAAQLDALVEMDALGEDFASVLTPEQNEAFGALRVMLDGGTPGDVRSSLLDMRAVFELRLIFQALPDMGDARKQEFMAALRLYQERLHEIARKYAADPTLDRTQMRAEMQAAWERYQARLASMLTDREKARVQALRERIAQDREALRDRMREIRINQQLRVWTSILGLDESQRATIKSILLRQDDVARALRERLAGDPAALRAALLELQQRTNAAILEQLTRAQRVLWEKMQRRLRNG